MAPDMVEVVAEVLAGHVKRNIKGCDCGWAELGKSHWDHQAAAVVAALTEGGAVEWALFRKTDPDDADAEPVEEYKFASAEEAMHWAIGDYIPSFAATVEPRSRITFPWGRAE